MDSLQVHEADDAAASAQADQAALNLMRGDRLTPMMIESAESALLGQPQVACPVIHRYGPGIYIREVAVPANTFAVGHHQTTEHLNIFLQGRVTVFKEDGTCAHLVAPMCFVGPPGRKIGYVHEDMVWLNVYATSVTDIDTLEAMFLDKSKTWDRHSAYQHSLEWARRQVDRDDFTAALAELGVSAETVRSQSESIDDMIPFPLGGYKVKLARSAIEGRGLCATADIAAGEVIAPARIGGMRTPAGRYTNHAQAPNAAFIPAGPNAAGIDFNLVALTGITGSRGGADGEEITVNYRQAVAANNAFQKRKSPCQE